MLLLAKILAVAVLVLFFMAAQKYKQPPVQWALIGLVGYVLVWGLAYGLIHVLLPASVTRGMGMGFLVMQVPAIAGAFVAYLVRGKLIADAINNPGSSVSETE